MLLYILKENRLIKIKLLVKIIFCVILFGDAFTHIKAQGVNDFVSKIRSGVAELSSIENATVAYKCRYKLVSKGEQIKDKEIVVKRNGSSIVFLMGKMVVLINDDYMACLEKKTGQKDWALVSFDRSGIYVKFKKLVKEMGNSIHPLTCVFNGETIKDVIDDPTFLATSATVIEDGLIELKFKRNDYNPDGKPRQPWTGAMVVSPKNHYALLRLQQTIPDFDFSGKAYLLQSQFDRKMIGESGSLRCEKIETVALNGSTGEELSKAVLEFHRLPGVTVDPAEFDLAYYNIPLPNDAPEDRPGVWWGWYIVGGIFLLIAAIIFRRMAR